jgi:dienelactone hydrolase
LTDPDRIAFLAGVTLLAFVVGGLLPPGVSGASPPATEVESFDAAWTAVLGDEGPRTVDRVVDSMTPGCPEPRGSRGIESWARLTRRRELAGLGTDLNRVVRSAVIERTVRRERYAIDVVRLEVFPGLLMPVNVYVPDSATERKAPLVMTPTGCESSLWSPQVQRRAANLASLGMVTVVTDGFCSNGLRRDLPDSNPGVGYARQLMGLPGDVTVYLQELVSTLTWAVSHYPEVDPDRIGVAGYSYGGQMAMLLAVFDERVDAVSVPATGIGESCEGFALHADLWAAKDRPDIVWSAPIELPVLPTNWRLALLHPRSLHTTAGFGDLGAHPDVIGESIAYARRLHAAQGLEGRILYRTDPQPHNYGRSRREHTYEWLAHTLLDEPLGPRTEREVELVYKGDLSPDISATTTLSAQLAALIDAEIERRFPGGRPGSDSGTRTAETVHRLFPLSQVDTARTELVWETTVNAVRLRALRVDAGPYAFPAFIFESGRADGGGRLLYLPRDGTRRDLPRILRLLEKYETVVSLDYLGIGELESDRLLLHSVARYFMHNDPSLPQMNVELLRSWLRTSDPLDIFGCGWASSFYAALLAHLEPAKVANVHLDGAEEDELRYLASGARVPDLLLQGGLFAELTVAELAAALGGTVVLDPRGSCR